MKSLRIHILFVLCVIFCLISCNDMAYKKSPIDYVDINIGDTGHFSRPAYPVVHLPGGMLKIYPKLSESTSDTIPGLPVAVTGHRGNSSFTISPVSCKSSISEIVKKYTYDNEIICPYRYSVYLNREKVRVDYALSYRSGIYNVVFEDGDLNRLIISAGEGNLEFNGVGVTGQRLIDDGLCMVYIYMEAEQQVKNAGSLKTNVINYSRSAVEGGDEALVLDFSAKHINIRYGISFVNTEQARENLRKEINTYSVDDIAKTGRATWNEALGKIEVRDGDEDDKTALYTSLYRVYASRVNMLEDGRWSGNEDCRFNGDEWISILSSIGFDPAKLVLVMGNKVKE